MRFLFLVFRGRKCNFFLLFFENKLLLLLILHHDYFSSALHGRVCFKATSHKKQFVISLGGTSNFVLKAFIFIHGWIFNVIKSDFETKKLDTGIYRVFSYFFYKIRQMILFINVNNICTVNQVCCPFIQPKVSSILFLASEIFRILHWYLNIFFLLDASQNFISQL